MSKKKLSNQVFTAPTSGKYSISVGTSRYAVEEAIEDMVRLINKNVECGLLLDWDIKVKDTRLARKMYPDHVIRKGWLYAKEV